MRPTIIGIDPGVSGAVAVISHTGGIAVFDLPTKPAKRGKTAQDIDSAELSCLLFSNVGGLHSARFFIEDVQSRPRQAGQFAFGTNFGRVLGVVEMIAESEDRVVRVPSSKWKPALDIPTGATKHFSTELAKLLFPDIAHLLTGPRGGDLDGRAEALLIAYYGRKVMEARNA